MNLVWFFAAVVCGTDAIFEFQSGAIFWGAFATVGAICAFISFEVEENKR